MNTEDMGEIAPPFPEVRPAIAIEPAGAEPFTLDFRELPWWFAVPEVGESGSAAWYDPPDWRLSSIQVRRALRPANVHELDCVELKVVERSAGDASSRGPAEWLMYGRLTGKKVQWVATAQLREGKRILRTFLDEGFAEDWGEAPRRVEDRGEFRRRPDDSLQWSPAGDPAQVSGAGAFRVAIGDRTFTCLRVFDVGDEPSEKGTLVEAYLDSEGRTVLFRRYNGRLWAVGGGGGYDGPPWEERFPEHARIVINEVTFVHWYDCLTDVACGISDSTPASADV